MNNDYYDHLDDYNGDYNDDHWDEGEYYDYGDYNGDYNDDDDYDDYDDDVKEDNIILRLVAWLRNKYYAWRYPIKDIPF